MTESQTFKKRSDFQSNDDYAVYVRENIQVRYEAFYRFSTTALRNCDILMVSDFCAGGDDGKVLQNVRGSV